MPGCSPDQSRQSAFACSSSAWFSVVVFDRRDGVVDRDVEVVVEVAAPRRRPREAPLHPVPIREQLLERRTGDGGERDVVVLEVQMRLVEAVGDRRAARAAFVPVGVEHEVVHDQLRTAVEQVGERGFALLGVEDVVLVDAHPRQLSPLAGEVVVQARQLLFGLEQLEPFLEPLLTGSGAMLRHRVEPPVGFDGSVGARGTAPPERPPGLEDGQSRREGRTRRRRRPHRRSVDAVVSPSPSSI